MKRVSLTFCFFWCFLYSIQKKKFELPTIEIIGNKFFSTNTGQQFYLKGIAYQKDVLSESVEYIDPLADFETCKRDLPYFLETKTNVLRVYAIDPTLDHDKCMDLLAENGIYVIFDLSLPSASINRNDPSFDIVVYRRYTDVIDALAKYTNVLGFFAGNEVTNDKTNTGASVFVKTAIKASKLYIKEKNYRNIPVGYSSNDDLDIRDEIVRYFACGDDDERADFLGINMYEWCGISTYEDSGYKKVTDLYKDVNIPLFFSEYGCNDVNPRLFQEVQALYGPKMTDVWSGGIVYMYFQEENNYGLVEIKKNKVVPMKNYYNYKNEISKINPFIANVGDTAMKKYKRPECPTISKTWKAANILAPFPDYKLCQCMAQSLNCVFTSLPEQDDAENYFNFICSHINCSQISSDPELGNFGVFSTCGSLQKLNYVVNQYYMKDRSAGSCYFDGKAMLRLSTLSPECKTLLNESKSKINQLFDISRKRTDTSVDPSNLDENTVSPNNNAIASSNTRSLLLHHIKERFLYTSLTIIFFVSFI